MLVLLVTLSVINIASIALAFFEATNLNNTVGNLSPRETSLFDKEQDVVLHTVGNFEREISQMMTMG